MRLGRPAGHWENFVYEKVIFININMTNRLFRVGTVYVRTNLPAA